MTNYLCASRVMMATCSGVQGVRWELCGDRPSPTGADCCSLHRSYCCGVGMRD